MNKDSLNYKIMQNRRRHKWNDVIRRIRLKIFDYEDQDKAISLITKIRATVLKPCQKCGRWE